MSATSVHHINAAEIPCRILQQYRGLLFMVAGLSGPAALASCLGLFLLAFLCGCSSTSLPTASGNLSDATVLRVGVSPNAPPLIFLDNGQVSGLEAEFARGLARFTGRKLRFVQLNWTEQIPALLAGKTDIIMSGMTITDARRYQIAFAEPYLVAGQVSLVRLNEYNRFSDGFPSLISPLVRVGVVRSTTGDFLITRNKAKGKIIRYGKSEQGVQALLAGEIDAFVYDLPMNFYYGSVYADRGLAAVAVPMSREFLAWGLRKEDATLREQANRYLMQLKQSGALQRTVIRWIPFYENILNQ